MGKIIEHFNNGKFNYQIDLKNVVKWEMTHYELSKKVLP